MADPGTEAEPTPSLCRPARRGAGPAPLSFVGYDRRWLGVDLVAGLTVWAVLVPESLAYASIAGVSPVVGLYAAPPALLFYAAVRQLPAPDRRADVGHGGALGGGRGHARRPAGRTNIAAFTAALAITTGRAGAARGPAALRVPGQLHLRAGAQGLHRRPGPDDHHRPGAEALRHQQGRRRLLPPARCTSSPHLGDTNGWTLVVGAGSLAVVLAMRRFAPAVPGELVAVILERASPPTSSTWPATAWPSSATSTAGCRSFGLPHGLEVQDYLATVASAAGIMLVGFAEGLGAAKTYAVPPPLRHRRQPRAARPRRGQRRRPACAAAWW